MSRVSCIVHRKHPHRTDGGQAGDFENGSGGGLPVATAHARESSGRVGEERARLVGERRRGALPPTAGDSENGAGSPVCPRERYSREGT